MSSLTSPGRVRAPRTAAAVERARLALVPARAVGAPRAPFAILVFLILGAGVVGLLMFNTQMQQASFRATELADRAQRLAAQRQGLDMELERLRDPQRLAGAGRELGMVVPSVPAFLRLSDGKVLGVPTVATSTDSMRIYERPARTPAVLDPEDRVIEVVAKTPKAKPSTKPSTKPKPGQIHSGNGPASTDAAAASGSNNAASAAQGAPR